MSRFGFEPINMLTDEIALIGFCPAEAEEWGDASLLYLPKRRLALAVDNVDVTFTPQEVDAIDLVYREMI